MMDSIQDFCSIKDLQIFLLEVILTNFVLKEHTKFQMKSQADSLRQSHSHQKDYPLRKLPVRGYQFAGSLCQQVDSLLSQHLQKWIQPTCLQLTFRSFSGISRYFCIAWDHITSRSANTAVREPPGPAWRFNCPLLIGQCIL